MSVVVIQQVMRMEEVLAPHDTDHIIDGSCEAEKLLASVSKKKIYEINHTITAPRILLKGLIISLSYFFTINANLSFNLRNHFS
jgi:hypothetical protein